MKVNKSTYTTIEEQHTAATDRYRLVAEVLTIDKIS